MRAILLLLGLVSGGLGSVSPQDGPFVCPPCGAECHFREYERKGGCTVCGMDLVPLSTVPQVGVLVYPGVELASSTFTLAAFADSNAVRAFSVSDATDPVRCGDTLELVPQFAFDKAPALDVLVIPAGHGAHQDPLIVEWVKKSAEKARFVLAIGPGNLVLARTGLIDGQRVPGGPTAQHWKGQAQQLVYDDNARLLRTGKFFSARDALAGIDGVLEIVAELAGEESAKETAQALGHTWTRLAADAAR